MNDLSLFTPREGHGVMLDDRFGSTSEICCVEVEG
jgi:hypothetical protein